MIKYDREILKLSQFKTFNFNKTKFNSYHQKSPTATTNTRNHSKMAFQQLSDTYGYVLLSCVLIAFQLIIIGFVIPMGARKKVFTQQFMKENFGKEHMEAFNEQIKGEGYPDMGGGKYSQKLSYKQWYEFNSAQRAHYNFLEWIASTLAILLIAGIYFPIPSAALGLAIFLGRLIYAIGYMTGGPQGRLIGVLINDFAFLGTFVLSFISSVFFIVGKQN